MGAGSNLFSGSSQPSGGIMAAGSYPGGPNVDAYPISNTSGLGFYNGPMTKMMSADSYPGGSNVDAYPISKLPGGSYPGGPNVDAYPISLKPQGNVPTTLSGWTGEMPVLKQGDVPTTLSGWTGEMPVLKQDAGAIHGMSGWHTPTPMGIPTQQWFQNGGGTLPQGQVGTGDYYAPDVKKPNLGPGTTVDGVFAPSNPNQYVNTQYANNAVNATTPSWAYNTSAPQTSQPSVYNSALNAAGSKFFNSADPYVQAAMATTAGNIAGAQQATAANRVNQYTPYASLQYQQTGTDAYGNPVWSATQSLNPQFQGSLNNLARNVAQTTQNAFNPTDLPSMGINPGETYSDAIMRRLQPTLQIQQQQFDQKMANQGIPPGTEAYNNAKRAFDQQQNDLLTSAQIGGIGVGQQANQQAFNQKLAIYNNPLQQLGAFQAATTPGYVNPAQQATVAGPDILGATATSNANALALQNAANARLANLQSGLYGLGSSALLGGGGLSGLGSSVINGLKGLAGLFNNGITYGYTGNQYDNYGNLIDSNYTPVGPDWANVGNYFNTRD